MSDVVVPQLARKETIPLPFMEPGDDLLKDGVKPSSPTDYCAALLRDGKSINITLDRRVADDVCSILSSEPRREATHL